MGVQISHSPNKESSSNWQDAKNIELNTLPIFCSWRQMKRYFISYAYEKGFGNCIVFLNPQKVFDYEVVESLQKQLKEKDGFEQIPIILFYKEIESESETM